jgi:pSer/pThr/pTyr-binding forkhead associated (FHA) protein
MWKLRVWDGGAEPPFEIDVRDDLKIGRAAPPDACVLRDANAGRLAARIVIVDGAPHLEDLGSKNPTMVSGRGPLTSGQRIALSGGLVFEIGRSRLQVVAPAGAPARPPAQPADASTTNAAILDSDGTLMAPSGGAASHTVRAVQADPLNVTAKAIEVEPPTRKRNDEITTYGEEPVQTQRVSAPPPPPAPTPAAAPLAAPKPVSPPPAPPPPPPAPVRNDPPQAAAPLRPAAKPADESADAELDVGGGTMAFAPVASDKLALVGVLSNLRPRLVVVNDADRRAVPIRDAQVTISRESAEIKLAHPGVSAPHARITFVAQSLSFQIEDLESRNQTLLGALALNPRVPQLLQPESLIRFGPIEAVFVVSRDSNNEPISAQRYTAALEWLQQEKAITPEQAQSAKQQAASGEQHVGEALMLSGVISARVWTRAFEQAAQMRAAPAAAATPKSKLVWIIAGVAIAAAAAAWFLKDLVG